MNNINRLINICLDIAEIADEADPIKNDWTLKELHMGNMALSGYLRKGVKSVIDLQGDYHHAVFSRDLAKRSERDARDYLEKLFGDREPDTFCDEYQEKIREFVGGLLDDDDEDTEKYEPVINITVPDAKPCPFCGETDIRRDQVSFKDSTKENMQESDGKLAWTYLRCSRCGIRTEAYCYEHQALDKWNRREESRNDG